MPRKTRTEKLSPKPAASPSPVVRTVKTDVVHETGNGKEDGQIWLARIAKTKRLRERRRNGSRDWERFYLWHELEMWHERGMDGKDLASDSPRDTAVVAKSTSIALTYISFLTYNRIKFKCKPRRVRSDADVKSARIQTALLNYEWGERGMQEQAVRLAEDTVIIGHSVARTNYVVEVDESQREDGREIEYREYVRKDAATLERLDPMLFLFDLSGRDGTLRTARWTAEGFFIPYADLIANTKFNREVLDQISSGNYPLNKRSGYEGIIEDEPQWRQLGSETPEDSLALIWELFDKGYKKHYYFAEGVPVPLLEEDWPFTVDGRNYLDGFPYTLINYIHTPNSPYGMGVYRLMEDDQMALNRLRTAEFHWVKINGRKYVAKGDIHPNELTKFTDGPPGTVIKLQQGSDIEPVPDAPMPADYDRVEARIQANMEETSGSDALMQGRALPSRTTAGEIAARTNLAGLKSEARVGEFERGITEIGRQILQHLKANRTVEDVIEIVGPEGAEWVEYSWEDIQSEVDIEVEWFAAPKYDPALDRQQRITVMDILTRAAPIMAKQTGRTVRFDKVAEWVTSSFDDSPEISTFFQDAPLLPQQGGEGGGGTTTPQLGGALAPGQVPQDATITEPGGDLDITSLLQMAGGSLNGPLAQ